MVPDDEISVKLSEAIRIQQILKHQMTSVQILMDRLETDLRTLDADERDLDTLLARMDSEIFKLQTRKRKFDMHAELRKTKRIQEPQAQLHKSIHQVVDLLKAHGFSELEQEQEEFQHVLDAQRTQQLQESTQEVMDLLKEHDLSELEQEEYQNYFLQQLVEKVAEKTKQKESEAKLGNPQPQPEESESKPEPEPEEPQAKYPQDQEKDFFSALD